MRFPHIVKRSTSSRSFLGVLCLSSVPSVPSPSLCSGVAGGEGVRGSGSGSGLVEEVESGATVSACGVGMTVGVGWVVTEEEVQEGVDGDRSDHGSPDRSPEGAVHLDVLLVRLGVFPGAAVGGFSNSLSSMLALFTYTHDFPSSTILLSTFRVTIPM